MITEENLLSLKSWFSRYVDGFQSDKKDCNENISLKIEHTKKVCIEILDIAHSLNLDRNDFYLAEAVALLHDIGRFEQYFHYGTFIDGVSEDHAALGVKILSRNNILYGIDQPTRELIFHIIKYHNHIKLPSNQNENCLFFLKLLRDADKIDIWRVVTDYYRNNNGNRNNSIEFGLPDTPDVSDEIISDIMDGHVVRIEKMKTFNDFKLLQMSWVYDINFPRTFQIIRKRRYLEKIYNALPHTDTISEVYLKVKSYLEPKRENNHCFYAVP